jgi:hypothetical protein
MPGVDFRRLRDEITMEQVLQVIGFKPTGRTGAQWYGACPLHDASRRRERCFSVNVSTGRYCCHRCHSHGNQLELWAAFIHQPLHPAAIGLCQAVGQDVPWIARSASN